MMAGAEIRLQFWERVTLGDATKKVVQQLKLQYESEHPSLQDMWKERVRVALFGSARVTPWQCNARVADCVGARPPGRHVEKQCCTACLL